MNARDAARAAAAALSTRTAPSGLLFDPQPRVTPLGAPVRAAQRFDPYWSVRQSTVDEVAQREATVVAALRDPDFQAWLAGVMASDAYWSGVQAAQDAAALAAAG